MIKFKIYQSPNIAPLSTLTMSPTRNTIVEIVDDTDDLDKSAVLHRPTHNIVATDVVCTRSDAYDDNAVADFYSKVDDNKRDRTLAFTFGEFDTIIVKNSLIADSLFIQYGALNFVINHKVNGIVFCNKGDEEYEEWMGRLLPPRRQKDKEFNL